MSITSCLLVALIGCGSAAPQPQGDSEAAEDAIVPLEPTAYGWLSEVALDPGAFGALVEANRDGWVALHAHDYHAAVAAFSDTPHPRARAQHALGVLYSDLSMASGLANEQLYSEWDNRQGLPAGNQAPLMAALASWCSGGETAGIWAGRIKQEGQGYGLGQALIQGRSPFDAGGTGVYGHRMTQHRRVRDEGDLQPLMDAALLPIATMNEGDFTREYWDPCIWRTLSDRWTDDAGRTLRGINWRALQAWGRADAPLSTRLFAPWLNASDLRTEMSMAEDATLLGSRSPTLRKLGVGTDAFTADDPTTARNEVRSLDQGLDMWRADIESHATADGRALLSDLGLFLRFRQEWLVARARFALAGNRPRQALAYLDQARDRSDRAIGAANSPSLLALTAVSQLRLGHTREALDAIHLLTDVYPEALGLKEVLGDLATLQGLDRRGDSKEN